MATASAERRTAAPARFDLAGDPVCMRIPASACTLAGFRAWVASGEFPEEGRIGFFDSEIWIDMTYEDPETHVVVKGEVFFTLIRLNKELQLGRFYPDGARISNEGAGMSNDPDGIFVSWDGLDADRVRLVPRERREGQFIELEGSPDWVLEVISNSSVRKDTVRLRDVYHRAGIREYWLIDARREEIDFQILHWRKTGYAAAPNRDGWQRSRVFGRSFRLSRRRTRRGLWEYTLEVQAS